MLSEKKIVSELKNHNPPPLQVKWSVPIGKHDCKNEGKWIFLLFLDAV